MKRNGRCQGIRSLDGDFTNISNAILGANNTEDREAAPVDQESARRAAFASLASHTNEAVAAGTSSPDRIKTGVYPK